MEEVETAIANNETVNRKHAHSVFIGPTGSGKSSLLDRMLDRRRKSYTSTDVLEKVIIVDVDIENPPTFHPVTVELDSNTWVEVGFDKSVMEQMEAALQSQNPPKEGSERDFKPPSESIISPAQELTSTTSVVSELASKSSSSIAESASMALANKADFSVAANLAATPLATRWSEDPEIRKFLTSALKKRGGLKKLTKSYSLYLRDAGGQVEFQEMTSLLLFGPSIFFFVFRADLDFQSTFTVEYRKSDREFLNCYTSSITIEEALLQSLASVYAMDTPDKVGIKTHKPRVFIVATHKDKLGPSACEKIAELNEHLDSVLENSRFQNLVEYADWGRRHVMFAVDNTSESDDDFKVIRSRVHGLICDNEEFSIEYPVSYLLFCLHLQNDQRSVLTLDECRVIAAKYGIVGDQVLHLLRFLHLRIGVIQFIEIEGMKPVIMKEPQILFRAVTDIIVRSFFSTRQHVRDIANKGILTESVFRSIVPGNNKIPPEEFLKILVHLRFITPLSTGADQEKRYFIPCVLNHVSESTEKEMETDISPLYVTFKCDHCPRGLFGVLVSHLLRPTADDVSSITFKLIEDKIFKDQVSFEVHSPGVEHDELSLKVSFSSLEIKFYPEIFEDYRDISIASACSEVRWRIDNAIHNSLKDLHYNKFEIKPMMCLRCDKCEELHEVKEGRRYTTYCKKIRRNTSIPSQARCWYKRGKRICTL